MTNQSPESVIAEVIEYHADTIGTHYEGCYKHHAGCLAVKLRDMLREPGGPDAATGRFECDRECIGEGEPVEDCSAHGRTPRDLWEQIDKVAAERDAALAAVERMRAIHFRRESQYRRFTDQSVIHCGTCTYAEWPCPTIAALDGAPEPDTITIPRPVVPFGPVSKTENEATADYLLEVVKKIDGKYCAVGGSNVTATVRKLLVDAADAVRGLPVEGEKP